jgi:hypothetical protein
VWPDEPPFARIRSGRLLQLNAEVLLDRLLDFPRPAKAGLNREGIAGVHGNGGASVLGDGDLAFDQVDKFVGCICRVVGAGGRLPSAADHAAICRGVLDPCLHRGIALDLFPAVKIGGDGLGSECRKAIDDVSH